jgi:serine/threonine protein kinase
MDNKMQDMTGQSLKSINGNTYTLEKLMGSGSQGVVYSEISGKQMVKLYYPSKIPQFDKEILEKLSFVKNVKKPQYFIEIRDLIDSPYIGYVMDRVIDHVPLNKYLIPPVGKISEWYHSGHGFRERLFIGYLISKAFFALSTDNLSYCDISGNNILIKLNNKEVSVRMIDIDNIYVAGRGKSSVLGTPRYIAPEIINKTRNPDVFSDNYSLAVILFELLRAGHPYISDEVADGTPEDEDAAFAGKYKYVTSGNSSNMLPENVAFTDKLRELFRKCFVSGKENRMERPSAKDFMFAMLDACNKIIKCPSCKSWHYPIKKTNYLCPWCNEESMPDAFFTFHDRFFSLAEDGKIADEKNDSRKAITTYFPKEGKNTIHNFYVLRPANSIYTDSGLSNLDKLNDYYFTIVKDKSGYHVFNEFNKTDICVKRFPVGNVEIVEPGRESLLKNGDEILFDIPGNNRTAVKDGKNEYKLIRTAVFAEVKQ